MTTIRIQKEYEDGELFAFVTDTHYLRNITWITSAEFSGFKDEAMYTMDDGDGEKKFSVTERHIAQAVAELIEKEASHCNQAITLDSDEWDSCVAELILETIAEWN